MPFSCLHGTRPREILLDRNYVDDRECRLMMIMKRNHSTLQKEEGVSPNFGETSNMVVWGRHLSEGRQMQMQRHARDVYSNTYSTHRFRDGEDN